MTKRKPTNLRKNAEINDLQSPHDGIHTCSKGCSKPGCNRGLRDTIEEQDKQIQALKQDLLEQTAAARHLRMERIHDINQLGGLCEENARLKAEVEQFKFTLEEERQISRQDWAGLRCEHDRVKRALEQAEAENGRLNDLANDPYRLSKGWRPIETAPMDGTDILCFCVEPEFEGEENPWTEFRVCFYGQMQEDYSCWMSHYGYEQRPTHWMPLPKPPAAKDGKPTA